MLLFNGKTHFARATHTAHFSLYFLLALSPEAAKQRRLKSVFCREGNWQIWPLPHSCLCLLVSALLMVPEIYFSYLHWTLFLVGVLITDHVCSVSNIYKHFAILRALHCKRLQCNVLARRKGRGRGLCQDFSVLLALPVPYALSSLSQGDSTQQWWMAASAELNHDTALLLVQVGGQGLPNWRGDAKAQVRSSVFHTVSVFHFRKQALETQRCYAQTVALTQREWWESLTHELAAHQLIHSI